MNAQTNPITSLLASLTQAPKSEDLALVRRPPPGAYVPTVVDATPTAMTTSPGDTRLLRGRPRTGAVASLPKDKRDLVCRLIGRGVPYKKIAQALEQLGFVITERNISNWVTHGGYAEWCTLYNDALQTSLHQDALLQYHRSDSSPELAEVGLQSAAVRLSELLLSEAARPTGPDGNLSKVEPVVTLLCRVSKELLNLQKHRDDCQIKAFRNPARIRAKDHDKLVELEARYSAGAPKKFLENECPPDPAHESQSRPAAERSPRLENALVEATTAESVEPEPHPTDAKPHVTEPQPEPTAPEPRVTGAQPRVTASSSPAQTTQPAPILTEPELADQPAGNLR